MQAITNNAVFPGATQRFPSLEGPIDDERIAKTTTRPKRSTIIYWATTLFLASGMFAQGFGQVFLTKGFIDMVVAHLGYPSYFLQIIGVWKIVGVIAILIPGFKRLKEWAYAGFFFVMSGALFSHIAASDPVTASLPALLLLSLIVISWYFRPEHRKINSPTAGLA